MSSPVEARESAPERKVVITGAGLITPLGDSLPVVMEALREGQTALQPEPEDGLWAEARIQGFDPGRYANVRGMRVYNRTTQLGISAAALALRDAGLEPESLAPDGLGVVMASSFGHLDTLAEYDLGLVTRGIERTNPALMPLAIASAPGAATALAFQARGCSITLAAGASSALDAVGLAARLVANGRLGACLVVAAFSPFHDLRQSALQSGWLSAPGWTRVYDQASRGTGFGEAGVAILLERAGSARARDREPLATLRAHGAGFAASPGARALALQRAIEDALSAAHCSVEELALVSSGANGVPEEDATHAAALLQVTTNAARRPSVIACSGGLGDALDANGLLQLLVGMSALKTGLAPVIPGLRTPRKPGLRYAFQSAELEHGALLVTAASRTGSASALVLELEA